MKKPGMKKLGWIVLALLFLLVNSVVSARVAIHDLSKDREWELELISGREGVLDGVTVQLVTTKAVTTAIKADRALVHVRLSLQGPKSALSAWINCRLVLRDSQNRVWAPMENKNTDGAVKILASDRHNNGRCNPTPYDQPADDRAAFSDQVFLVPVETLQDLVLHVSGYGTRPRALAFAVRPALTTLK